MMKKKNKRRKKKIQNEEEEEKNVVKTCHVNRRLEASPLLSRYPGCAAERRANCFSFLGHRRADLLQNQKHSTVPRAQPREVGGKALVKGREAAVFRGLDEAVEDAGVERGVCWGGFLSFQRGFERIPEKKK